MAFDWNINGILLQFRNWCNLYFINTKNSLTLFVFPRPWQYFNAQFMWQGRVLILFFRMTVLLLFSVYKYDTQQKKVNAFWLNIIAIVRNNHTIEGPSTKWIYLCFISNNHTENEKKKTNNTNHYAVDNWEHEVNYGLSSSTQPFFFCVWVWKINWTVLYTYVECGISN